METTTMHCCRTRPGLPFPRSEVQPSPAMGSCSPLPFYFCHDALAVTTGMHCTAGWAWWAHTWGGTCCLALPCAEQHLLSFWAAKSWTHLFHSNEASVSPFEPASCKVVHAGYTYSLICCRNLKLCIPLILFSLSQIQELQSSVWCPFVSRLKI